MTHAVAEAGAFERTSPLRSVVLRSTACISMSRVAGGGLAVRIELPLAGAPQGA